MSAARFPESVDQLFQQRPNAPLASGMRMSLRQKHVWTALPARCNKSFHSQSLSLIVQAITIGCAAHH
jgi:hypothetical protein